jgi:hypothetical protein
MAMTPYNGETLTIANIGTTPQERAMETSEFKMAFSKDFHEFVEWFNLTHKTEFEAVQTDLNSHKAENLYRWAQGVNDLVITTGGDFKYVEGAIIRFGASNTNTGAVTLNVDGKGVRPLKIPVTYAELPPGRLKQYQYYEAIYNSSHDCFFIKVAVQAELDRIPVPSGADMNDYITPGNYRVLDTATAATLLNYPATDGGTLEVLRYTSTFFIQRLITSTTGVFYQRTRVNGVWSSWNMTYNTTNITVSTSAPVSALAEGFQHQVY